jgi:hypothetical protein
MNEGSFDALTRRASLVALSTAGLAAALGESFVADAKKKHGKNKKKCRDRCAQQVAQCTTSITAFCSGEPTCLDTVACCPILENCDFAGFFTCLVASASA